MKLGAIPQCVLFDLDGTLADTAPDLSAALNRLLVEQGRVAIPLSVTRPVTSQGVRGLLRVGLGLEPDDADYPRHAARVLHHYASAICEGTQLFDGMPTLLDLLDAHHIKWGIVTNKHARFTEPLVAALGLAERAACVVSGDSATHPKPHPAPLLLACSQAGVPVEATIYVGDDVRDIEAGRAAGMRTIAAAWGYLGHGVSVDQWGADFVADNPAALFNAFSCKQVQ